MAQTSPLILITVLCILLIFLSLEVVLRIRSLFISITRRQLSHRYLSIQDPIPTSKESLKPYQIIFGHSMQLSENAQYFLDAKITLLRVVLVSSVISLAFLPFAISQFLAYGEILWISLLILIVLHHLLSCLNLQFDYVFADLPFLLFEITAIIPYFNFMLFLPFVSSTSAIGFIFFSWVVFVGLVLEAIIWAASLIVHLVRRSPSPASVKAIPKPQNVLFGNSLWKTRIIGETWITTISRRILATILILALCVSSVVNIVLSPIKETHTMPVKDMRSPNGRINTFIDTPSSPNISWSMVFATSQSSIPNMTEWDALFRSGVNVTQLSDDGFGFMNGWNATLHSIPDSSLCNHAPGFSYPKIPGYSFTDNGAIRAYLPPLFQVSAVHCPSNPGEFLITVNFTTLQIPIGAMNNMSFNSLQIMVGLNHNIQGVIERTAAITLIPGTNLFGTITWDYRQVLKNPSLSSFGLFESYDTVMVSRMLNVIPDPLASESPLIAQSREIATFRLFMPFDNSELNIIQESRTRTVLQGFSSVGGLWTFLSGVFAALFGSSIFRILFGGKPISFFGLVHSTQRKNIQKAWMKKYPEVERQIRDSGFEGGLFSLLLDEVIDLKFLEVKKEGDDPKTETGLS